MKEDGMCSKHGGVWMIATVVLLAAILIVAAFSAGSMSNPSTISVQTSPDVQLRTLNVSGSVTNMVMPDKVDIVLSVETLDKSAQKSQSDNAIIAEKVKTALESLSSVKVDVKTVSYSVNEEFEWNDYTKKSDSIGYRTVNQIQLTLRGTDINRAGSVIDLAVQSGANRVSSVVFGLSEAKELRTKEATLKEASTTAKAKAESIASGLNVKLGKIHSISESSYYYTPNYKSYDVAMEGASNSIAPTPITPGDIEVSASVSVEFEIQ